MKIYSIHPFKLPFSLGRRGSVSLGRRGSVSLGRRGSVSLRRRGSTSLPRGGWSKSGSLNGSSGVLWSNHCSGRRWLIIVSGCNEMSVIAEGFPTSVIGDQLLLVQSGNDCQVFFQQEPGPAVFWACVQVCLLTNFYISKVKIHKEYGQFC